MYNREIPHRQLTAWLSAAMIPGVIQVTAGASWLSVLLVGIMSVLCVWFRWRFGGVTKGKLIPGLQWGVVTLVLGSACQASVQCWPRGGHPVVAVVLLALAMWSAWKGPAASARVGCVLFWFVLLLYPVLLGAGVKDVKIHYLLPTKGDVAPFGCVLLLTPAVAAIHLNKRESFQLRLLLPVLFCTVAAVVTAGVLSPQVATTKVNAFYEMTRSLNLLGQARRFEALLSAGATAGWFALYTLYLTVCARLAEIIKPGWWKWGMIGAVLSALVLLLCDMHIPGALLPILTAVFWVLVPLLTQGLGAEKKS